MSVILYTGIGDLELKLKEEQEQNPDLSFVSMKADEDISSYLNTTHQADALLVGSALNNPIPLLQKAYAKDKMLSVVLVAAPEDLPAIKQRILFAPFVGGNIKMISNKPVNQLMRELQEAANRTKQKRSYSKLTKATPEIKPTLQVPDQVRNEFLNHYLDFSPIGAVLLKDMQVMYTNRKALSLIPELNNVEQGLTLKDIFNGAEKEELDKFLNIPTAESKTLSYDRKGIKRFLSFRVSPIRPGNDRSYKVVIVTDITNQVQWEEALKRNEETLRMAVESTELGTWDLNLVTREYILSEKCRHLLGIPAELKVTYDVLISTIHPDDRGKADEAMRKAMDPGSDGVYDIEYRVIGIDGKQFRWIRAKGKAFFNYENVAERLIGTVFDITAQINYRLLLEENLRTKDEFIGIASHELKTPLTSIKAYVQLLDRSLKNDVEKKQYVRKASYHIEKLNNLISDLLDISKIHTGKLQFNFTEFKFDDMVKEVIDGARHVSETHSIVLRGASNITVKGDRSRLEQVLDNYISNAIKYSPEAKEILVEIRTKNKNIIVSVKDYGVGIPKEKLSRIFERFYRVERTSTKFQGLGIGLYIASEIIKRHNGRVWVESEEGKGTTFYFSLPIQNI